MGNYPSDDARIRGIETLANGPLSEQLVREFAGTGAQAPLSVRLLQLSEKHDAELRALATPRPAPVGEGVGTGDFRIRVAAGPGGAEPTDAYVVQGSIAAAPQFIRDILSAAKDVNEAAGQVRAANVHTGPRPGHRVVALP